MPITFEGMMEVFGFNLERQTLYDEFEAKQEQIDAMTKRKDVSKPEILQVANEAAEMMMKIMSISIAEPSSLKNVHNNLFLNLIDHIQQMKSNEE